MIQITNVVKTESQSFVANDPAVCCCMQLPLNATSFENGFSTTKELVCSVFDEESYACET